LRELAVAFGVVQPSDPKRVIESTVAELLKRQRGDGGFALWPESGASHPWVSPYVLFTLSEARTLGYSVPEAALEAGAGYLRRQFEGADSSLGLASRAYAADVLGALGRPDPGYTTQLFQRRAELPAFAQALLLHAMVKSGQPRADVDTLAKELEARLEVVADRASYIENLGDEYAVLLDSPARTTALVLRGLLAARPEHPLGARLARGLLSARRGGAWRSTQETAFALLALDAYQKAQEASPPSFSARIWAGDKPLFEARFEGRSLEAQRTWVPMSELERGRLVFQRTGTGTLFYEARLRYAPAELPTTSLERGFSVLKTYRPTSPDTLEADLSWVAERGTSRLPAGSLVIVDLVLVAPGPRNFTVLDDPLPAGLEAVDSSLATSASWESASDSAASDRPPPSDDMLARGGAFLPVDARRELRDDRVLFFVDRLPAGLFHFRYLARATTLGTFVVPPTRAEEMYTPETFGRTRGQLVTVE
jgi:hypothetical protein